MTPKREVYMKKLISILLVLIFCFCITPAGALTAVAEHGNEYIQGLYKYIVSNGEAEITEYTGADSTVVIPEFLGGYPVTGILPNSFYGCYNLMNVTIPDSVETINFYAFLECENLRNVYIGSKVRYLDAMAFSYCPSLVNISVADDNLHYSSLNGILFNKIKTELIKFPEGLDIEYSVPSYVTKIGPYAFYLSQNLISVTIPKSVTKIGEHAFAHCYSLKNVNIGENVNLIDAYAFSSCTSLADVVIPNKTQVIGDSAFSSCYNLERIIFGEELTTIGSMAFAYCSKIDNIKIPNKVTIIETGTFLLCSSLTSVTIPESVVEMEQSSFSGCPELIRIDVAKDNTMFSSINGVLFNKTATELITYPNSNSSDYSIPQTVTTISDYAFADCINLSSVIIPRSVTKIGEYAFYGCYSLVESNYVGNENEWSNISIKEGNYDLLSALNCNYCVHDFELYKTIKATYTSHGYKQYNCKNCSMSYKINILKLKRTSIKNAKVSGIKNKAYRGKSITQSIKVKLNSKTLKKNTDYTVSYKNNKSTGKAKVTIKGKGKYEGTITKTFIIYPKKATLKSLKSSSKKQIKITWKKDKKASGYKIVYARNSKFTKSKKTITVKGYKTYKKTIKKLKSKKTYYVKVRAYKTVSGKKYYGAYSKVKKIKVK